VVADGRQQTVGGHPLRDLLGRRQVRRERLLDEEREAAFDGRELQGAVRERRHAQPHRVELLGRHQRRPVAVRPGPVAGGGLLGTLRHGVGHGHDLDVVERRQRRQVAAGDEPGAHARHTQAAHAELAARTVPTRPSTSS
jgi:hypothetical protein